MDGFNIHDPASMMMNGLKTSLIAHYQTGNVIMDSIISVFLLYIVTTLLRGISGYFETISTKVDELMKRLRKKECQISFYAYEQEKRVDDQWHNDSYPVSILGIVHHMELTGKIHQMRRLREIFKYDDESTDIKVGINDTEPFEITKEIMGRVYRRKHRTDRRDLDGDDNSTSGYVVEFVISSQKLNAKQLADFVSGCIVKYNEYMILKGVSKHFYFRYIGGTGKSNDDDDDRPRRRGLSNNSSSNSSSFSKRFDEFIFHTNRNFGNIFFEQKEQIIRKIDFFSENEEWYNSRGIPHTLGMLFYGSPGCGKTSTIKALANHTKRHVVEIQLSKIKTAREFMDIFHNETIMGKIIPLNRRIYVLEDIDCMGSIVKNRTDAAICGNGNGSGASTPSSIPSSLASIAAAQVNHTALASLFNMSANASTCANPSTQFSPVVFQQPDDKLTLSVILNALDGVLEMPGRIVIMTTNHPEQLDPALIRPGRIDMKVEFKKCSPPILNELIQHFYQCSSTDLHEYNPQLNAISLKWTPAEVSEIMMRHDDFANTIRDLVELQPHAGFSQ